MTLLARLASALRNMPCTCVYTGAWPRFKPEVKAHPERTCARCAALNDYELHLAAQQSLREAGEGKLCEKQ